MPIYKDFLEFGRERGILFTGVQIGSKCLKRTVGFSWSWKLKSYKSLIYCSIWMKIGIYECLFIRILMILDEDVVL